jgi:NAD(P)-dependent dehydrogenase (short-subunit alcohol dehydrogenase family)
MVAKLLDVELADQGVLSLLIHPGHVQTDMGGDAAPLTPETSVKEMVRCIEVRASYARECHHCCARSSLPATLVWFF